MHLAIILVALGVVGSSFYGVQKDVALTPGETAMVGGYTIGYVGSRTEQKADRTEFFNTVRFWRDGGKVREKTVWRAFYPSFGFAATRAAIHSTPVEDLYIVSTESPDPSGRLVFRILVNPLVWWLWMAGPLLLVGTLVALWPQASPAAARSADAREETLLGAR